MWVGRNALSLGALAALLCVGESSGGHPRPSCPQVGVVAVSALAVASRAFGETFPQIALSLRNLRRLCAIDDGSRHCELVSAAMVELWRSAARGSGVVIEALRQDLLACPPLDSCRPSVIASLEGFDPEAASQLQVITVHAPWAIGIVRKLKPVENRRCSMRPGWFAVRAGISYVRIRTYSSLQLLYVCVSYKCEQCIRATIQGPSGWQP